MERIIRDELYMKCQNRTVIYIGDKQYGFLPSRSCITQMTYVIDDIATTINKHNDVDIVYFDFAKVKKSKDFAKVWSMQPSPYSSQI